MEKSYFQDSKSDIFLIKDIEKKANADKLFICFLLEVEKRDINAEKEFTISEISDMIPIGTAGVLNYSTYGFSIMSMLSGQKGRDYFIFENDGLRAEFTTVCNNNHDRDNYYWRKFYGSQKVKINPKYLKNYYKENINDYLRIVISFYQALGNTKICDNKLFEETNSEEWIYHRLERAVLNHKDNNAPATCSRYAIWAASLKSLLIDAKEAIEENNDEEAIKKILLSINSLSAYIDIQAIFDTYLDGIGFYKPEDIINDYERF
jgi:hypothetical protein